MNIDELNQFFKEVKLRDKQIINKIFKYENIVRVQT